MHRCAGLLFLGVLVVTCAGCRSGGDTSPDGPAPLPTPLPLPTLTARVGGHPVTLEIADEPHERQRGLMHRRELAADHGMLFVFPDSDFRKFWMRNTLIPLDIAYVKPDGVIGNIVRMQPHEEHGNYWSRHRVPYAIELNAGWFEQHQVTAGALVELPGYTTEAQP